MFALLTTSILPSGETSLSRLGVLEGDAGETRGGNTWRGHSHGCSFALPVSRQTEGPNRVVSWDSPVTAAHQTQSGRLKGLLRSRCTSSSGT